jgi:TatD DNase family protein
MQHLLHDTHVHLEMLLGKLELLQVPDERKQSPNSTTQKFSLDQKSKEEIIQLTTNHEFLLHSTVSTFNYQHVSQLLAGIDKVKFFLGSHPELVTDEFDLDDYIRDQKSFINKENPRIIGIGEVGLDYYHTKDTELVKVQKLLFQSQIELAIEMQLPLMIHCRDAFEDVVAILKQYPKIHGKFLIHCFTGSVVDLKNILELGGKVAFGGVVSYKSAIDLQNAVTQCPVGSFVLETDLPFLAPVPHRGSICIPEMITNIADKVGELKNLTNKQVWEHSRNNTLEFLGIQKNTVILSVAKDPLAIQNTKQP